MNTLFIAARAVHFASAMLLLGELVFVLAVAKPAWRDAGHVAPGEDQGIRHRLLVVALWAIVASLASGAAWLAAETTVISGMPIERAMNPDTLVLVLGKTVFGRVWTLRLGLIVGLCALLLAMRRSTDDSVRSRWTIGAALVAAAYLATLAWAGHAAAGQGLDRFVQIASDVVHLLAAGAWLGALPGLAFLLGSERPLDIAAAATRRFSTVGMASVSALLSSGLINAWYLVGDVPALVGTHYGHLLLAKLALFVAMVTLAVVNRWRLTPRVLGRDRVALSSLRRNAALETVAGLMVVMIVGALGITIPAAHQSPTWPFDHTLSWQPFQESLRIRVAVAAAVLVACMGVALALRGAHRHRPRQWVNGLASIATALTIAGWLLAVPAYPTSYVASPVPYSVDSIVRGSALYTQRCGVCHGPHGHGDGPAAASLPIKPANLVEHSSHHHPGDLFWWIAHGITGTPMQGFASQLSDVDIWDLIQFLRAQADSDEAMAMTDRVEPWRPIVAPDFTFEIRGGPQESLKQQRGRYVTLLVLYTLPQSLPRLGALATAHRAFGEVGVRIIAVPFGTFSTSVDADAAKDNNSISAIVNANVATAYTLFTRQAVDSSSATSAHVEFLIDRQGYLRARWIGVPDAAADRIAKMPSQIELLNRERPHAPLSERHAH